MEERDATININNNEMLGLAEDSNQINYVDLSRDIVIKIIELDASQSSLLTCLIRRTLIIFRP